MIEPPIEHRVPVSDTTLSVYEWNPHATGAVVLLAHATGFHARCWDHVVAKLAGRRVLSVDQRGHGRSAGALPVDWRQFGADLVRLLDTLDLREVVGVGHSMGGHAMTDAAALRPDRFRRLLLIDPVIAAPEAYLPAGVSGGRLPGDHPTAKRRDAFHSVDEMIERFAGKAPFDTWNPGVLRDYCAHGVEPAPEGGLRLACRPAYEAEVYMTSRGNGGIHDRVAAVTVPVLVVRAPPPVESQAGMDFRASPTWPALSSRFRFGEDRLVPHRTHFLPMEDPALAARLVLEVSS